MVTALSGACSHAELFSCPSSWGWALLEGALTEQKSVAYAVKLGVKRELLGKGQSVLAGGQGTWWDLLSAQPLCKSCLGAGAQEQSPAFE